MSKELKAFLEFIDTNSPTDEYTKCLADAVQTIKKDDGARDLYMTIEQQRLEDIAYTETRVREEMQQYVDTARQEAADAKQQAANAELKADNAERKNIANIITMCKNFNCSDEQIINRLIEMASLSHKEASKALSEY